jgi:hypothetical protein
MSVTIFTPENESQVDIEKVSHLYKHKLLIQDAIRQHEKQEKSSAKKGIL